MKRSLTLTLAAAAITLGMTATALAQATVTTEVKQGTVIGKTPNSVIVQLADGSVKEFQVPAGKKAMVDGKEIGLDELKIGTVLTQTITTTTKPVEVKTTTIKEAEVFKVQGSTLVTKEKDGLHTYKVPTGFRFNVEGRGETALSDLTPGMKLTATIVHTSHKLESATTKSATGAGPAEAPKAEPAPAPKAEPAPAPAAPAPAEEPKKLPKTGSPLALLGLLGAASVALGSGLRKYRLSR